MMRASAPVVLAAGLLVLATLAAMPLGGPGAEDAAPSEGADPLGGAASRNGGFSDLGGADEPVSFENVSEAAGLSRYSGNYFDWGDYDRDGDSDLLVNGRRLLRNNGAPDWDFTDVTADAGLGPFSGVNIGVWGDYDRDGDLDVYLAGGGWSTDSPTRSDRLMRNDGAPDWTFTDVTQAAGGVVDEYPSVAAAWVDIDGDGFLDLYVANYENASMTGYWPDTLWRNDRDGTFTDVSLSSGIRAATEPGRSVTACDYDEDGDMDIHVGNYRIRPNFLWRNDGTGRFTDVASEAGVTGDASYYQGYGPYYGHTIGAAWADWNNDGLFDLWEANLVHKFADPAIDIRGYICDDSKFYRANGPPDWDFTDVRPGTGIPTKPVGGYGTYIGDELYDGIAFADVDNDGDLDVFMPQVYGDLSYAYSYLYLNRGDGTFVDMAYDYGVRVWNTYGAAWADYDLDGDLDLVTGGFAPYPGGATQVHLFRNSGNTNNWLRLELAGTVSNTDALGAKVTVIVGNVTMTRQVEGASGSHGQMGDLAVEFGLGRAARADTVRVRFPSGIEMLLVDVAANRTVQVLERPVGPLPDITADSTSVDEDEVVALHTTAAAATGGDHTGYYWDTDGDWVFELRSDAPQVNASWPTAGQRTVRVGVARLVAGRSVVVASDPLTMTVYNVRPVASAGDDRTIAEDEVAVLDGSRSYDTPSDKRALMYRWLVDGVDRGWSASPNTTVSWANAGTHEVELHVKDDDGMSSYDTITVVVENLPPVVHAPDDTTVDEDEEMEILASATDTPSDQAGLSYRVDFGDGQVTGWVTTPAWTHTYATSGVKRVLVEARDDDRDVGAATFNVTVANVEPAAAITAQVSELDEGEEITVFGSVADTLSDLESLVWRFDFGDGNATEWKRRPVQRTSHSYDRAGSYDITLWARDDDGATSASVHQVEVANLPPYVELLGPSKAVVEDELVVLTATALDTGHDLPLLRLTWDMGDGSLVGPGQGSGATVTHSYPAMGTYIVVVTASDDDGAEASAQLPVRVDNAAPEAFAVASAASVWEDEAFALDAAGSTDTPSDRPTLTYEWDLGDGRTLEGVAVNASWSASGRRTVILTVTDDDGATAQAFVQLDVRNRVPSAEASADRTQARTGDRILFTVHSLRDTPGDLPGLKVLWDLGDGTLLSGTNVSHAYKEGGDYLVKVTVKDDDGAVAELYIPVTIEDDVPFFSRPAVRYGTAGAVIATLLVVLALVLVRRRRLGASAEGADATRADESGEGQGQVEGEDVPETQGPDEHPAAGDGPPPTPPWGT